MTVHCATGTGAIYGFGFDGPIAVGWRGQITNTCFAFVVAFGLSMARFDLRRHPDGLRPGQTLFRSLELSIGPLMFAAEWGAACGDPSVWLVCRSDGRRWCSQIM